MPVAAVHGVGGVRMSSVTPAPSTCDTTAVLAALTWAAPSVARLPAAARAWRVAISVSGVTPSVIGLVKAGITARRLLPAGKGTALASASSK